MKVFGNVSSLEERVQTRAMFWKWGKVVVRGRWYGTEQNSKKWAKFVVHDPRNGTEQNSQKWLKRN